MPNPSIGTVICPLLGDLADVRQDKNNKLYYVGEAGIIAPKSQSGQTWLKKNAKLDNQPEPEPKVVTPEPESGEREPTAKSGGLFDDLLNGVWGADDE
ncbi:hypothetical protein ABF162_07505 [Vibrio coralliilyticus]|uniref:hypothetical protein n=1 Tax=Vibrio coralliilyticus TaxID=190893 RepID=UPI00345E782D